MTKHTRSRTQPQTSGREPSVSRVETKHRTTTKSATEATPRLQVCKERPMRVQKRGAQIAECRINQAHWGTCGVTCGERSCVIRLDPRSPSATPGRGVVPCTCGTRGVALCIYDLTRSTRPETVMPLASKTSGPGAERPK